MIGVIAGVVSALLPSIPTIVKFSNDNTPVNIPLLNITMPYNQFLFIWIVISAVIIWILLSGYF